MAKTTSLVESLTLCLEFRRAMVEHGLREPRLLLSVRSCVISA